MFLVIWYHDEGSYHALMELTWDQAIQSIHKFAMHPSYLDGSWDIHQGIMGDKRNKGNLIVHCYTVHTEQYPGPKLEWRTARGKLIPDILKYKPKLSKPKSQMVKLAYDILAGDPIACDMARDILKI